MPSYFIGENQRLNKAIANEYGKSSLLISTLPCASSHLTLCHNACMNGIYPKEYRNSLPINFDILYSRI